MPTSELIKHLSRGRTEASGSEHISALSLLFQTHKHHRMLIISNGRWLNIVIHVGSVM
jgi:hypothetical protein